MRQDNDTGLLGVFENMVRTSNPVKLPSGLFEFAHQVGAVHVCMIHIDC